MASETDCKPQQKKTRTVAHPVAVVVFVPVEVDGDLDGVRFVETRTGAWAPVEVTSDAAAAALGAAAIACPGVGEALDALLVAARDVQDRIAGAHIEATAWFGGSEFREVV